MDLRISYILAVQKINEYHEDYKHKLESKPKPKPKPKSKPQSKSKRKAKCKSKPKSKSKTSRENKSKEDIGNSATEKHQEQKGDVTEFALITREKRKSSNIKLIRNTLVSVRIRKAKILDIKRYRRPKNSILDKNFHSSIFFHYWTHKNNRKAKKKNRELPLSITDHSSNKVSMEIF